MHKIKPAKNFNLRCLTAGISLGRKNSSQIAAETAAFLLKGRQILEAEGYKLQMIRMATNPFPEYIRGFGRKDSLDFIKKLADFAREKNIFLSIGAPDPESIKGDEHMELICSLLPQTEIFAGIHISTLKSGICWSGIRAAARLVKKMESLSMMANFRFAALAHIPAETPFFPAAFHVGPDRGFTIGTETAGLVRTTFEKARNYGDAAARLKALFEAEFKALETAALFIQKETGWNYDGLDTSPAPMKEISIGAAVESLTRIPFGGAGTLSVCELITRILQSVSVRKAGYCGLMLPVMEDEVLAQRASQGRYGLSSLLNFSAVCGTGLDVIPLPGDVPQKDLERILADVACLADRLKKPLSARLIPIPGKKAGDDVHLDSPYLVGTKVFDY